jgi:hypothetical protein
MANAKLMAAAPEMLETLQLVEHALNCIPRRKFSPRDVWPETDTYEIASRLRRLIKKAIE